MQHKGISLYNVFSLHDEHKISATRRKYSKSTILLLLQHQLGLFSQFIVTILLLHYALV
jgi:hypothetical protein